MANFSELPNEMVLKIWGHVLEPKDVESFALVSKDIYTLGKPFVEEHNKLKRDFSSFYMNCWTRASTLAIFLKEVLLHPRVALYVSHLSIGPSLAQWQDQEDGDDDDHVDDHHPYDGWQSNGHVPNPDDITAIFVEAIRKSNILPLNKASNWIKSVKAGDEYPILALLLMRHPNLTTLSLMDEALDGELFEGTNQVYAGLTFLIHLTKINIRYMSRRNNVDLTWWKIFAGLPCVQFIHVADMAIKEADNRIDPTQWLIPFNYNLTGLTFTNSGLSPRSLFRLLESVRGLRVFSYVEPNEEICPYEPFWIRAALLANAKHSLESLKILPSQTLSPQNDEEQSIGSFREFRALKELEITLRLLLPRSAWYELTALLPTSIEKFYLHFPDDMSYKEVTELVETIAVAKPHDVPKLRELKIRTGHGIDRIQECRSLIEPLEESCRKVGIELKFIATRWKGGMW